MDNTQLLLSSQICFPIYSASRLITKAYKPYLDKMGITYPQYLVLLTLWENNGLSVNQITKKLLLNTNTLSPLLKRMEKLELLKRNRSSEDERSVIVELTEKGQQLREQALPIPLKLLKELISDNIKIEEVLQLKDILNKVILVLSHKDEVSDKS